MPLTKEQLDKYGLKVVRSSSKANGYPEGGHETFAIYAPSNNDIGLGGPNKVYGTTLQEIQKAGLEQYMVDLDTLPTVQTGNVRQNFFYGSGSGTQLDSMGIQSLFDTYNKQTADKEAADARLGISNAALGANAGFQQVTPAQQEQVKPPAAPVQALPTTTQQTNLYQGAAGYTGPSIVDFLKTAGQPSDRQAIINLMTQYGVIGNPSQWTGSAAQNTQLLNVLKGFASGKVSPLGVPASVSSGGPTMPSVSTPINVESLGKDNSSTMDLSKIFGANSPANNISVNSDIAGLLSLYGASSEDQKSYDALAQKLTDVMDSLGKEGVELQAAMDANGVGAAYEQVKQLNLKAVQLKGELDQFDVGTMEGMSTIEGQSIPTGLITGQQAQLQKQRDLTRLSKAAELSSVIALSQAYQGNAELGMELATKSIELKYQPIQNQIDVLKTQLGFASEKLSKADAAKSNVITALINMKGNEIATQKKTATDIMALAIQAASNGAPLSVVNAIKNSADPASAAMAGNQFLKGNNEKVGAGTETGGSTVFTSTQLNKGAANAGIPIAEFSKLSDDSKNYYINSYAQFEKDLAAISKDPPTEDPQTVFDNIASSNLNQDVKDNLSKKLQPYLPAPQSGGGFADTVQNAWNFINPLNWFR